MSESHEEKGEVAQSDGINSVEKGKEAPTLLSSSNIDFPKKSSPSSSRLQEHPEETSNSCANEMGSLGLASQGSPVGNSAKSPLSSSQSPSRAGVSSARSPQARLHRKGMDEPFPEEESEENMIGNRSATGRSGSAGTITVNPSGFPSTKRSSFHSGHGRKLPRRSSFLNEPSCSPTQIVIRPPEPLPQQPVVQTRRCSLSLPYPVLYGSWQVAALDFPPPGRGPADLTSVVSHRHPPPLLKRRSLAQFDMSRMHAAEPGFARNKFHRRTLRGTSTQMSGGLTASPEAEEEETPVLVSISKEIGTPEEIKEEEAEVDEPYLLQIGRASCRERV